MIAILAFITIFIATYFAYKTAKDYGRNPIVWAFIVFATGFGIQIVIPSLIAIIIGVVMAINGSSVVEIESALNLPATILGIASIVLSIGAMLFIIRFLGTVRDDDNKQVDAPPPPSHFNLS